MWTTVGTVTALFQNSTTSIATTVTENKVQIPWEMMNFAGSFRLSLFADDLLITNQVDFIVYTSGYTDESVDPAAPTPNVYHEILETAVSGGFNGKTAYQSAVEGGYVGSEAAFNNDLSLISNKANYIDVVAEENARVSADNQINELAQSAYCLAQEKSSGREFATYEHLMLWLADPNNVATLKIGDVFWIVDTSVPDYWWGTSGLHELETQKVDLVDYLKKTDDIKDTTTTFAESLNLENIVSGEKESVFKGKLKKWYSSVISKFGNINSITFGAYDNIVNAVNDIFFFMVDAFNLLTSSKADKTSIVAYGCYTDIPIPLQIENNTEYRLCDAPEFNGLIAPLLDNSSEFIFSVIIPNSTFGLSGMVMSYNVSYSYGNINYRGDDCTDGIFVIAPDKKYEIRYYWDGWKINAVVRSE